MKNILCDNIWVMENTRRLKFRNIDFTQGPIWKNMVLFALPVLLSNVFQLMYTTVDTVIIGHTLGDVSLAAVGAATSVYDLFFGCAFGMSSGLSIVIARNFGSGKAEYLRKAVATAIMIGIATVAVLTLGFFIGLKPFLRILSTPENIMDETYAYISVQVLFMFVLFAYNLLSGILRAVGNSLAPLVFLIISSCLNVAGDFWCILGLDMGIKGAAVATVAAQGVSDVLCLIYIWIKVRHIIPHKEDFKPDRALYKEMLAQGFSMGLMECVVFAGSAILQIGINGMGYLIIAAHTTAKKLYRIGMAAFSSMNVTVNTFVSQNFGAGNAVRIRQGVKTAYVFNAVMTLIIMAVFIPFAPDFARLISGSSEPDVIDNAAMFIRVVAPSYVILGFLNNSRTALQSIGQKILPVVASVIELIGKILFTIFLVPKFGYMAVVFCEPIIWVLMSAELVPSFWLNPFIRNVSKSRVA